MYISKFNFVLHTIKYQGVKIMLYGFHQIFIKIIKIERVVYLNDTYISTLEIEEESVKKKMF